MKIFLARVFRAFFIAVCFGVPVGNIAKEALPVSVAVLLACVVAVLMTQFGVFPFGENNNAKNVKGPTHKASNPTPSPVSVEISTENSKEESLIFKQKAPSSLLK